MSKVVRLAIVSDIHHASAAEKARGGNYEIRAISSPPKRLLVKALRHFIWLRYPLDQDRLLDRFLQEVGPADFGVANGDYSCDTGFVGVMDEAAFQSARECLERLRGRFGARFSANLGDHEVGKLSLMGGVGGMRLASYHRARRELGLEPFWRVDLDRYVLMGVASSLVALPVFEPDTIPEERGEWRQLREQHLADIRAAFKALTTGQRVLLFCHDPTALPFLWREDLIRSRLPQIEQTIVGHLHSRLILWKSRLLAGMPAIRFLGNSARRMTSALSEARRWKPFRVRLCPSLAGIELLKDGGFLTVDLDPAAREPARFCFHPLPR